MKELETVALLKNIALKNLERGDVGVVVAILSKDTVEVEFTDKNGKTITLAPIKTTDLIKLNLNPVPVEV
jgi:hypothetical protein